MRVIDKTPLQDAKGNISFTSRVQGTLKYGLNWYAEYQSQKVVLNLMDRFLDKGFIAIRNFNLPDSDIIIPIIVIGPGSLTVILSTPINGQFEANETAWNIVGNNASTPAKRNLINILSLLTRAFQRYLKIHNINVPVQVEPVLIATDPGANIETNRPAVRVVRSDAIKQFISTLNQARPLLRVDQVNAIADLILEPNPTTKQTQPEPKIPGTPPVSRAKAIFNAAETPAPGQAQRPRPAAARPAKKKQPALKPAQIALLVVMGIIACCIAIAAVYFGYSLLTI